MRIAALILGLMFAFGEFAQSLLAGTFNSGINTSGAAGFGVLGAFALLFGAALVLPLPRVAMALFLVAGACSWLGYASNHAYGDLEIWGTLAVILAVLAYLGYRSKRREDARQAAEDAERRWLLSQVASLTGQAVPAPAAAPTASPPVPTIGDDLDRAYARLRARVRRVHRGRGQLAELLALCGIMPAQADERFWAAIEATGWATRRGTTEDTARLYRAMVEGTAPAADAGAAGA